MKVLFIWTHPVPESYSAALRDSAMKSVGTLEGVDTELLDLYVSGFQPNPPPEALERNQEIVAQHRQLVQGADALVFVHPTWWDALPAILKGWLELLLPDALESDAGRAAANATLGHIRSISVITTHGSPKRVNIVQGQAGKHLLLKSLRSLCPKRCSAKWIALYSIDRASDQKRAKFIQTSAQRLRRHIQTISS